MSYIEDARCLKVKHITGDVLEVRSIEYVTHSKFMQATVCILGGEKKQLLRYVHSVLFSLNRLNRALQLHSAIDFNRGEAVH